MVATRLFLSLVNVFDSHCTTPALHSPINNRTPVGQDSPFNMDRAIISQYTDLKREKLDIEDKIQTLDSQISAIEGHLSTLTEDESVICL